MANKNNLKKKIEKAGEFGKTNACCIIDAIYDLKASMDKVNTKELAKQIKYLHLELEDLRKLRCLNEGGDEQVKRAKTTCRRIMR